MLEILRKMVSEFAATRTFAVGICLIGVSIIIGCLEYRLSLNRKRIVRRIPEGIKTLNAVVCGILFTASSAVDFFPIFHTMFKNSLIGLNGERVMPVVYSVIPIVVFGIVFAILCYEIAKYSGRFENWFLRKYRKNHKMYIR